MPHEWKLIALMSIGFVLALGFLAAWLRLPPLPGYLPDLHCCGAGISPPDRR
jgi:predicted Kef-type K+ transport protein